MYSSVIQWSLSLTAKAFVAKLFHKCRPLLWVYSPSPVSVQLCPDKITNRNLTMCAVELLVPGDYNIKATLHLADGSEMFCLDIYTELV